MFIIAILSSISDYSHCQLYKYNAHLKKYNSKVVYKTINISKNECFEKIINTVKLLQAKVVKMNLQQGYIIAYKFNKKFDCCLETTEVTFLLYELQPSCTTVIITSNNSLLNSFINNQLCQINNI
jgi:hypothetical protein